jgi:hypothetical protein
VVAVDPSIREVGQMAAEPPTTTAGPGTAYGPQDGDPAGGDDPARRRATATALAALTVLVLLVLLTLADGTPNAARWSLLGLVGGCWVAFAVAAWALLRTPVKVAIPLLVGGAVVLQGVAFAFPPRSTDDFYRYVWDGRVQASGTDPYRYVPVDPALAELRDPWLFPPECRDASPPCTRMNHPTDPTIYPPVAQAAFLGVHAVTAWSGWGGPRPLQGFAALLAIGTTLALVRVLRRSARGDPRRAVLWAWCPTVVLEAGNNAHIDVLAALLVVVALGAAAAGTRFRAGTALGAAVATKLFPLMVLPALLAPLPRPGQWRAWARRVAPVLGACAGVVAFGYLPHVLAVGGRVVGFLPAYLDEEGYQGGGRFALLNLVLPDAISTVAGLALLAAVVLFAVRRADPARPWEAAVVIVGAAYALTTVPYPWYGLMLVALVALDGRWEWLAVAAAAYPVYFTRALDLPLAPTRQLSYGIALAIVAGVAVARRRSLGRDRASTRPLME